MFTLCSASIHPESRREGERAEPLDKPAPLKHKPSMTFLRPFLVVLALLLAFPAPAQPGAQTGDPDWLYRGSDITRDPAWRFGTLPNGLKYAVRRNTLPAGQVSIRIRIDAGALHEEDGERGESEGPEDPDPEDELRREPVRRVDPRVARQEAPGAKRSRAASQRTPPQVAARAARKGAGRARRPGT